MVKLKRLKGKSNSKKENKIDIKEIHNIISMIKKITYHFLENLAIFKKINEDLLLIQKPEPPLKTGDFL